MSIVRSKHDSKNPYVMLNKQSLWDPDLSLEALGLWARLISRPDNWEIHAKELATSCALNIRHIWRLLNELIDGGYCKRIQEMPQGQKGFSQVVYEVYEVKQEKDPIQEILTQVELTPNVPTHNVVCHTTNIESTNKEESKSVCIDGAVARRVCKNNGVEDIEIALSDFLNVSIKKDWELKEVNEAWEILVAYEGLVRDPMAFMVGTIKNIRKKKQHKYLNENKICQKKPTIELTINKNTTLEESTEEPVSLGYLLGMTDRKWL